MTSKISIHGHNLSLEHTDLGSVKPMGHGIRYSSDSGALNYLHAAIPTPNLIKGQPLNIGWTYVRYRMYDLDPGIVITQWQKLNPLVSGMANSVSLNWIIWR